MRHILLFALLAICVQPLRASGQGYANLALEGGGIRGIAYCGALEVLEARGILDGLQNIAGTSVGAVVGALTSVGYRPSELRELMYELRVETFNDGRGAFFGGQRRVRKQYGWYRGDALERWLEAKISAKTGKARLDFAGLHALADSSREFKNLFVTATNLSRQRGEIFSWKTRPQMRLATAVRASMSVPLYFRAMRLDSMGATSDTGNIYIDGGLVMNYPLTLFDSGRVNPATLGLKLERPEQLEGFTNGPDIAPFAIRNLAGYVGALYNLTIETLNRRGDMEDEQARTIYISTANINPRVRRITTDQKNLLYQNGYSAAEAFFRKKRERRER